MRGPLRDAIGSLSTTLGRAPTPREIASELGVSVDHVIEALNAQQAYSTSPLEILVGDTGTSPADVLGGLDGELEIAHSTAMSSVEHWTTCRRGSARSSFCGSSRSITPDPDRCPAGAVPDARLAWAVSSLTTLRTRLDAE